MMTVECIGAGFTYRWPGGEVHLEPGTPIVLPDERARRLLKKAPGRVRVASRPGDRITWDRGGVTQTGAVDFTYIAKDGSAWLFTVGPDWVAVNAKFATVAPDPACLACGGDRRWESIHGAIVCAVCHPPAHPRLVVRWLGTASYQPQAQREGGEEQ